MLYSLYFMCTKLYHISIRWTLHKTFGNAGDCTANFNIKNRKNISLHFIVI